MADYSEAFFLPWKGTAKKISYAASLGAVNKIDDTNAENIKKMVKKILIWYLSEKIVEQIH